MTKQETTMILGILKTSYPNFYKDIDRRQILDTIELWSEMFSNENLEIVKVAVKCLIDTFKFPPTIADIKDQIYKLQNSEQEDIMDLYSKLKKAISNGIYGASEEFKKLPPIVQKFVGSSNQLREWAIDENFNDGVLRGQFVKQVEIIRQREKEEKMMLPEVKQIIDKSLEKTNEVKYLN